jgi:hypothetical protein
MSVQCDPLIIIGNTIERARQWSRECIKAHYREPMYLSTENLDIPLMGLKGYCIIIIPGTDYSVYERLGFNRKKNTIINLT